MLRDGTGKLIGRIVIGLITAASIASAAASPAFAAVEAAAKTDPVSVSASADSNATGTEYVANEVLLTVAPGTSRDRIAAALAAQDAQLNDVQTVYAGNASYDSLLLARYTGDVDPAALAARLISNGFIRSAEPNRIVEPDTGDVSEPEPATAGSLQQRQQGEGPSQTGSV